ncbi:hypothetical protein [Micromonospora zamorensis]|uniref:hypothetical protein n=1 Tax=Micromonospora zamorensis TaxID=709883 RepID=UPI003CECD23D
MGLAVVDVVVGEEHSGGRADHHDLGRVGHRLAGSGPIRPSEQVTREAFAGESMIIYQLPAAERV